MRNTKFFIFLVLLYSITSSGMYEVYKEKKKLKDFEKSLKNMLYLIHVKNAVKCIQENFQDDNDIEFIEKITNSAIGNYYKQKYYLLKEFDRYKKCIVENTRYYQNGKYKREYYY